MRENSGRIRIAGAALFALAWHIAVPASAAAPYVTGNRTFPVTATTGDPFVADEFSASAASMRFPASDSEPSERETEFEFELEKRIAGNFGIEIEGGYEIVDPSGKKSAYGFKNLESGLKYQFYTSDAHELVLSVGVVHEFGGTGAERIGAESTGSTTPTLYFGKGLGDLPEGMKYLRPLAVTGTVGYQFADTKSHSVTETDPDTGETSVSEEHTPDFWKFGFALEYSLRYLQGNVQYVGLPIWLTRMTPLVEVAYTTPASGSFGAPSTGVVAPGVIYTDIGLDIALEAQLPVTRESGEGVGFIAKVAVALDKLGPNFFGRPLLGD
jgi:hypothetical protein